MIHYCFIAFPFTRFDALMVQRQGKALVKAGFKISYIVSDGLGDSFVDGISMIDVGIVSHSRFDRFVKLPRYVYKKAKEIDADVYQINSPEMLGVGRKLKIADYKVTFNMRENYYITIKKKNYIPKLFRGLSQIIFNKWAASCIRTFDISYAVDESDYKALQYIYQAKNVQILCNFPYINQDFQLTFEDYCKRGDVLLYEGSIYPHSRQENVFEALEKLPNVKYLMVGIIHEGAEYIKKHSYWDKVNFINGFTPDQLPEIFSKASISNVARDLFGGPGSTGIIKIYESMEAALPIIITNADIYRAMVDKYRCGICVDPNDSKQFESAIKYLSTHKKEAYVMGQNGRRAVIEEYSWDRQAEKYIDTIINLFN